MKPRVYVETSVVSYLGARPSRHPETLRRQDAARRWWEQERQKYELVAADIVRVEAARGDPAAVERRLAVQPEYPCSRPVRDLLTRPVRDLFATCSRP